MRMLYWLLLAAAQAGSPEHLWDRVQQVRQDVYVADPSADRRVRIRQLMKRLVESAGVDVHEASIMANVAGLTLESQGNTILLHTAVDHADGFYAIRTDAGYPPLVLEAPHPWDDIHTGAIAAALFEEGAGRALLIATAERDIRIGRGTSDVTRRPGSSFQAATLGIADGLPDALFVQIHGFTVQRHGLWSCVVSLGSTRQPLTLLDDARRALAPPLIRFGPIGDQWDVPELAGTRNVQGRGLSGQARFLHLELSREVRDALRRQASLRAGLASALENLAECPCDTAAGVPEE